MECKDHTALWGILAQLGIQRGISLLRVPIDQLTAFALADLLEDNGMDNYTIEFYLRPLIEQGKNLFLAEGYLLELMVYQDANPYQSMPTEVIPVGEPVRPVNRRPRYNGWRDYIIQTDCRLNAIGLAKRWDAHIVRTFRVDNHWHVGLGPTRGGDTPPPWLYLVRSEHV